MSKVENFLTSDEEQEIVAAIKTAEEATSGEIRIHIEKETKVAPFDRAQEVFHLLKMDETELKNGVLIYLAVKDKAFVICGDKGIDDIVGADFWDSTKEAMAAEFKVGNFKQGIINGIYSAGEKLKLHFPWQEGDVNELSNEISRG